MRDTNKVRFLLFLFLIVCIIGCASPPKVTAPSIAQNNGVVVAAHPIAAKIGLDVLKSGGNAIDAAVATGLALGVVDQFNSGIGGGGFIVIRMADGAMLTIDARETAPAAARRDMYIRDGEFDPNLSQVGPLAVGTPGLLAGYAKALELKGTKALAELIAPSIDVAEEGFTLDEHYLSRYNEAVEKMIEDPISAKIYFHPDGSPLKEGDVLKQADLANTYRNIARDGPDYFYKGEFAQIMADYMSGNGGLITLDDMANYAVELRDPIVGAYHGYEVIGMAPPSSGGVHIIQILNMLEASDALAGKTEWDLDAVYWTAQFMRKAFEDRAEHLGDIDFYPVPVEKLTDKRYAESCVKDIMGNRAPAPTEADNAEPIAGHTTNLCIIDRWGNAVAINQTVNLTYGAKITLPGTGVILNNEMDDFSAQPGVPNAFGLIGSEANSIAPGKRPLSSMSPTIIVRGDKPVLILGGAGGPTIITAVLQIIVGTLDFGMNVDEAQSQPRFHHQFRPDVIVMEKSFPKLLMLRLLLRGQKPWFMDSLGRVNAICWSDSENGYIGSPDPRSGGAAAGY